MRQDGGEGEEEGGGISLTLIGVAGGALVRLRTYFVSTCSGKAKGRRSLTGGALVKALGAASDGDSLRTVSDGETDRPGVVTHVVGGEVPSLLVKTRVRLPQLPPDQNPPNSGTRRETHLESTVVARAGTRVHGVVGAGEDHTATAGTDVPPGRLGAIHSHERGAVAHLARRDGSSAALRREAFLVSARDDQLVVGPFDR